MGWMARRLRYLEGRVSELETLPSLSVDELQRLSPEQVEPLYLRESSAPLLRNQSAADKMARLAVRWEKVEGSPLNRAALEARAEFEARLEEAEMITSGPPGEPGERLTSVRPGGDELSPGVVDRPADVEGVPRGS